MQESLPSYERFYRASRARIFNAALAGELTPKELMTRLGRIRDLRDERREKEQVRAAKSLYRNLSEHGKIQVRLHARATRPRRTIA